jgi:adenosylcobyric acid synthase
VIIVADIDKGGVFAQLVGTLMLLSESEQDRVVGFVINRFRGDITLLESGLTWLEERTNKPVLGVLPYLHGLDISSEDALVTQQNNIEGTKKVKVVVLVYPRMSNHTDFDALRHHEEIDCQFLFAKNPKVKVRIPACDLIILPGSKNVISDLHFLQAQGWDEDIARHCRNGGKVIGICGGYQMLGEKIRDPHNIEGTISQSDGLNYFPIKTELQADKTLTNVEAKICLLEKKANVRGYEIHAGTSHFINENESDIQPLLNINGEGHGLLTTDNQIAGCYLHGLFDMPEALQLIMLWVGSELGQSISIDELENIAINRISDACQKYLDMDKVNSLLSDWYKQ